MEDLYQQSETASLPKRLSLKHKARAGEVRQRLLPPSLPILPQSGGIVLWKGSLRFSVCHHFLMCFHISSLAALNYFDFQEHKQNKPNAARPPETRHWIPHAPAMVPVKVLPYPGALSRPGPSATPRTAWFLEPRYQHPYTESPPSCQRDTRGPLADQGRGNLALFSSTQNKRVLIHRRASCFALSQQKDVRRQR